MNDKPRESDWKLYSRLVPEWRDRYLQRTNATLAAKLTDPEKTPTDAFWDVLEDMKAEAKILASCLGEHSRSKMFLSLVQMLGHGLIAKTDLTEFSGELQDRLEQIGQNFGE
jgi:hypothetical protein